MIALRCLCCGTNWPNDPKFTLCIDCPANRRTYPMPVKPMDEDDAYRRLRARRHAQFDQWLTDHDRWGQVDKLETIPTREKATADEAVFSD